MTEDIIYKTNSTFDKAIYIAASNSWTFLFSNGISITSTGFWRFLKADRILLISGDHGQNFGLNMPIDLADELTKNLRNERLTELRVEKNTADLTLILTANLRFEIYITSIGFESYEFLFEGKRFIGMGSGEIGVVEDSKNPKELKVRIL